MADVNCNSLTKVYSNSILRIIVAQLTSTILGTSFYLLKLFLQSFNAVYFYLDLVQEYPTLRDVLLVTANSSSSQTLTLFQQIKQNKRYIIPFIFTVICFAIDFVVLLQANFKYEVYGVPHLFSHRIFPKELWLEADIVINIGIIMTLVTYILLLVRPQMKANYQIYVVKSDPPKVISHGKVWKQVHAAKLLNFRRKGRLLTQFVMACAYIQTCGFWLFNAYKQSSGSLLDIAFFLYVPFFALFSNFAVVIMSFYIALTVHYTRIKQQILVQKMTHLTKKLLAHSTEPSNQTWTKFMHLQQAIQKLFKDLRAYNSFWAPFVTLNMCAHVSLDTLLLFGWLFANPKATLIQRSFLIFFSIQCFGLILMITFECALIVDNFSKIFKTTQTFCYTFQKAHQQLDVAKLLKINELIGNHKGYYNGFRMVNNYIINSKQFEFMFFVMLAIFMFAIKWKRDMF